MTTGYLVLEDGTVFHGNSVAADGVAFGEAVFTTGMTGYQEVLTDPSY
ncbi:MAG TPA: carbamoyl-phosphate synthase domain-containing protein, partial [Gaiellaceae bacterium]|nr:carbamoyl-phosphate synthase domain-containing protein [Gaiellaceae bacterium]